MKKMRTRTKKGAFTIKRFDTRIETIEKQYGIDLGVRGDMKLGNFLKRKGYKSLSKMLKEV